ncbi:MAG: hypothetical protein CVU38_16895 [Chloroflexi bacterium HGW-Chloroflexi-1]|nr:MAG: hypothetical protein CVU38_16895 [Chloroflexi bacterium HGW-Chloroflexi-1]
MGDIYLELTIANIHDTERQREISFLVDTGSTRAWIPKKVADELSIQPAGTVPLELADGSITELPYGFCLFDFGGETIAGNVVIGPPDCEPDPDKPEPKRGKSIDKSLHRKQESHGLGPIVGTHVLQDYRVIIDMERHTVSRARAMKAKRGSVITLAGVVDHGQIRLKTDIR